MAMPPGYMYVDYVRPHEPFRGGLVVYFRSSYKYTKFEIPTLKTFEIIALRLFINKVNIILLAIYRPGSAPVSPMFFEELISVLEHVFILGTYILLAGDFNVHVERTDDPHAISLSEVFDMFQLINRIDKPTHKLGGVLDLIVSSNNLPVSNCYIFPCGIYSDHSFIKVTLPLFNKPCIKSKRLVRSWSCMNRNDFISLVSGSFIGHPA